MLDTISDINAITIRLKSILQNVSDETIFQKDVAFSLGITEMNFATMKKRNTIPYEEILRFCYRTGIHPERIFFEPIKTTKDYYELP